MKQSIKNITKRIIGAFLISGLLSATANAAVFSADTIADEIKATVKYVGTENDNYIFNVAYKNESNSRFLLSITDESGNTLFTGIFTDNKFDKRFKLSKDIIEGELIFSIKNLKNNSVQNFQVTTTTQIIEDVVVKRMNG
ncbi:MAG: hypothetical protein QM764_06280 [Chitinophagaceae bacterium]